MSQRIWVNKTPYESIKEAAVSNNLPYQDLRLAVNHTRVTPFYFQGKQVDVTNPYCKNCR